MLGGKITIENSNITVDAGILLSDLIKKPSFQLFLALRNFLVFPEQLGGAIVGNAGAYGCQISEVIEKVEVWHGEKRLFLDNKDCRFSYRESVFKKEQSLIILRAFLRLKKTEVKELKQISRYIVKTREAKYKPGLKRLGSFYKNILVKDLDLRVLKRIKPDEIIYGKIPAGFLLEAVGAKRMNVGEAEVAYFHGNLFINRGDGKAEDVKKLAKILKRRVKKKLGIELEEEIRYL